MPGSTYDDDRFHFGYTAIEPTLNMFKSLTIATCVYAVASSVQSLLADGHAAEYGIGMFYGVVATVGCFSISIYMRVKGKHLVSDLVKVDSHTWMIDGVLSASILFAFILAYALESTEYKTWAPYVDPVLLIILGSAMLPVPFKILRESLNEVINKAPPESISAVIEKKFKKTLADVPLRACRGTY